MRKSGVVLGATALCLIFLIVPGGAVGEGLPDGRGYEMVSPPDKSGGGVGLSSTRTRAAADGAAVAFVSLTAFGDAIGTGVETEYIAQREGRAGTAGWSTHAITPRQEPLSLNPLTHTGSPAYVSEFSPDLTTGIFRAWSPLTNVPDVAAVENLYVRRNLRAPGAETTNLVTECPVCAGTPLRTLPGNSLEFPWAAGASVDFRQILFESRLDLTGAGAGSLKLYLSDNGAVQLVGVVPGGSDSTCGGLGPACVLPPDGGGSAAGLGAWAQTTLPNVISEDGTHINFTAPLNSDSVDRNTSNVYQRDTRGTASTADDTTVLLNVPERSEPVESAGAVYQGASSDGSRVFFASGHPLTDDSSVGLTHLYMWDHQPNDEVQRLTVSASGGTFTLAFSGQTTVPLPANASAAEVASALRALSSIGGTGGAVDVTGGPGDDSGTSPYLVRFGGALGGRDLSLMTADGTSLVGNTPQASVAPWVAGGGHLTLIDRDDEPSDDPGRAEGVIGTSQDGATVYFVANSQLVSGAPAIEFGRRGIYLWHDGEIRFVGAFVNEANAANDPDWVRNMPVGSGAGMSWTDIPSRVTPDGKSLLFGATNGSGLTGHDTPGCGPGGDSGCMELYVYHSEHGTLACATCPSNGQAPTSDATSYLTGFLLATTSSAHESHALSDDGRRVFFTSGDALVPEDTNGRQDAYEYDSATGTVNVLSSGKSPFDSYFLDASANGEDAFFVTRERLVGWDVDGAYDLYDARVGGGFPDPVLPLECGGNACQGPVTAAPPTANAGSADYAGSGNLHQHARKRVRAKRCPRGKVRRKVHGKVRCVKKHRHHRGAHRVRLEGSAR